MARWMYVVGPLALAAGLACCLSTSGLAGGGDDTDVDAGDGPRFDATSDRGEPPDAGSLIEDANVSDVDVDVGACPSDAGPAMVRIPLTDGGFYCVDATEVTQSQYAAFLAATTGNTSGQPAVCAGNVTYASACFDPIARPNHPVACVDWCDARAYCKWAGKRLCGGVGSGSEVGRPDNELQWRVACSHALDGLHNYPYGTTPKPTACNTSEHDAQAGLVVGSFPACQGGYDGLFDMSGNVFEWVDSCADGGPDAAAALNASCALRGGSFTTNAVQSACDSTYLFGRRQNGSYLGFRCCAP